MTSPFVNASAIRKRTETFPFSAIADMSTIRGSAAKAAEAVRRERKATRRARDTFVWLFYHTSTLFDAGCPLAHRGMDTRGPLTGVRFLFARGAQDLGDEPRVHGVTGAV